MDMIKVRYVGTQPVLVPMFGAGTGLGRLIEPDELIEVVGRIVEPVAGELEHAGDAFLIEIGNPPEQRAMPLSIWRNETPAKSKAKANETVEPSTAKEGKD